MIRKPLIAVRSVTRSFSCVSSPLTASWTASTSTSSSASSSSKPSSKPLYPYLPRRSFALKGKHHEVWRDDNDADNLPKVKRRDGTVASIDKKRGFIDYHRNPDPYRDPLDRVFDWGEIKNYENGHDEIEKLGKRHYE